MLQVGSLSKMCWSNNPTVHLEAPRKYNSYQQHSCNISNFAGIVVVPHRKVARVSAPFVNGDVEGKLERLQ